MLRLPSARAPHSIRPWNQPTTFPSAMRVAVHSQQRVPRSAMRDRVQPTRLDLAAAARRSPAAIVGVVELRTPVAVTHLEPPGAAELMPHVKRRAQRGAVVTGSRLDVDVRERRL